MFVSWALIFILCSEARVIFIDYINNTSAIMNETYGDVGFSELELNSIAPLTKKLWLNKLTNYVK